MNRQEHQDFIKFYKKQLMSFLEENHLIAYKKTYREEIYINTGCDKNDIKINNIQSIDVEQLYLYPYGSKVVRFLLDNADENQREQIIANKFNLFSYEQLALSSYNHPQDMKDIFQQFKHEKIFKSYQLESIIKDMQKHCDNQLYDQLIDILLQSKTKEIKMKSNKIIVNLMLNTVKDDAIYEKYNNLIPNNVISDDFFEDLNIICFDINVSKDKLYSSILLANKDKYNDMHTKLLDHLNEDKLKDKLDIISIEGESKYKSSKYFRYICRVKQDGLSDKENIKLLIISYCKLYSKTSNNVQQGEFEFKLINNISSELIYNNYITYKLAQKNTEETRNNIDKKMKI